MSSHIIYHANEPNLANDFNKNENFELTDLTYYPLLRSKLKLSLKIERGNIL